MNERKKLSEEIFKNFKMFQKIIIISVESIKRKFTF